MYTGNPFEGKPCVSWLLTSPRPSSLSIPTPHPLIRQVVDDILDFTQSTEQLGKPQGQDLASGNLTAPVIFALRADRDGSLRALIESEFTEDGSMEKALELVMTLGGIEAARQLAREEGDKALRALGCLPESPAKQSLARMVDYVLERLH